MKRCKNKMPRLCSRHRCINGLRIPHLTDQNDIRIFSKRCAEAIRIGLCIGSDLPLIDNALIRLIHILDRILERDDMLTSRMIDLVQNRRKGGRFSGARLAGHQNNSPLIAWKSRDRLRQPQRTQLRDPVAQNSKCRAHMPLLPEQIDTDTLSRKRSCEIELTDPCNLFIGIPRKLPCKRLTLRIRQYLRSETDKLPVHTDLRRKAADQMYVRGAPSGRLRYQFFNMHGKILFYFRCAEQNTVLLEQCSAIIRWQNLR